MEKRATLIQKRERKVVDDLLERLREKRLMNPDYPTRLEQLHTAAENIIIAIGMGWDLEGVIEQMKRALDDKP